MGLFRFYFLHFALLVALAPLGAWAEAPSLCDGSAGNLSIFTRTRQGTSPEDLCRQNMKGARLDRLEVDSDTEADKQYLSVCAMTFSKIEGYTKRYKDAVAKSCAAISLANAQASSCVPDLTRSAADASAGYRQCLEQAKAKIDTAIEQQKSLIGKLDHWKIRIAKAEEKNRKALAKYREDLEKSKPALERTKALMNSGEGMVGSQAAQKFNSATGVSGGDLTKAVNIATNGGAPTLKDYVAVNPALQMEQQRAIDNAAEFQKRAQSEISSRQSSLSSLQEMQAKLTTEIKQAGSINSAKPSISSSSLPKDGPVPTPRPPYNPDTTGGSVAGQNTKNTDGINTHTGNGTNNPYTPTNYNNAPAGGSTNYASSLAPAAGALAGGAGGGSANTGSSYAPNYDDGAVADNGSTGNANGASGKNPQGYALAGDGNGGSAGADGNGQAPGNAGEQGDPTQIASAGNPNGLYPVSEETISGAASSGASVNPGSYGGAGSTGFSGSKGAAADSGDNAKVKEIAPKAQFSPDLDSGAVNIAGSEVNSALAALEDEFKTEDVKLDLDGLTAGEKKALSPDGALAGGVFSAPSSGGRQLASASQESKAVLDEDSTPLFPRNHGAIERAIKRGDLILGIKKKF